MADFEAILTVARQLDKRGALGSAFAASSLTDPSATAPALDRVRGGAAASDFDAAHRVAIFTIVVTSGERPVLDVKDGALRNVPMQWLDLCQPEAGVERALAAVGRIDVGGEVAGTGFLVGPNHVMTAGHVGRHFAELKGGTWTFKPAAGATLDFGREIDPSPSRPYRIDAVADLWDTKELDMAVLEVTPEGAPIAPLTLACDEPDPIERRVYAVGFPTTTACEEEKEHTGALFGGTRKIKRLAPGTVTGAAGRSLFHDCTTLRGNSGSCIVDIERGVVLGLHHEGKCMQSNRAVALWEVCSDLAEAGVRVG